MTGLFYHVQHENEEGSRCTCATFKYSGDAEVFLNAVYARWKQDRKNIVCKVQTGDGMEIRRTYIDGTAETFRVLYQVS
jgi:hypothetical protein